MSASRAEVKGSRSYDSSTRQARARATHQRTLDLAAARFLADGYEATTVAAIASDAGVSEATIYKSYGGKAGLARELCQRALRGDDAVPAEERSNALRATATKDELLAGWGRFVTELAPRGAPLLLVLRDAASADPEAAALFDELDRSRLDRMSENARFLRRAGYLRPEVTVAHARDVLWFTTAPETYDLLVRKRGWPLARFGAFVTDIITTITR